MAQRGTIRIIAGKWRRRRLEVATGHALRPTPDRVRETLFNWLAHDVEGARCLDLFAGSGALGFEAASRGAREVIMVERDPRVAAQLVQACERLGAREVEVVVADAWAWMSRAAGRFEVVFLDPPFGTDVPRLCAALEAGGLLEANAKIYVETEARAPGSPLPSHWSVLRDGRAGRVRYYLASPGAAPAGATSPCA